MLGRVGVVMLFVGSACAHADIINLSCAQTGETEYKLSYSFTASTHRVQIFASTNADPTAAMPRLVKTADTAVTVHAGRPRQRIYFFLKADTGEMREVSIRALPLEGATNFRDLGGYETGDGRFVRWGLLYRSAVLTKLTSSDMDYLRPLGIRVVCDFRRKRETDAAPEIWDPDVEVAHVSLPMGDDDWQKWLNPQQNLEQLRTGMMEVYWSMATTYAFEYSKVFTELVNDSLPLLYHCSGGKDRTGLFSAFVLLTLGVPQKTVLQDYVLTNNYIEKIRRANSNPIVTPQPRSVQVADPEYLEHTLRAIDEKYESFDNYRRQVLKVSDDDTTKLRNRLLMH